MRTEEASFVGTKVRVRQEHRILERRGMVGKVVGRYGGEEYVAVDVRFSDGQRRLFWPSDLEEIASPQDIGAVNKDSLRREPPDTMLV